MGAEESKQKSNEEGDDNGLSSAKMKTQKVAKVVGVCLAAGAVAWGISSLSSSGNNKKTMEPPGESSLPSPGNNRKKMKPPGRPGDGDIFRDEFEENPGDYFKKLRVGSK